MELFTGEVIGDLLADNLETAQFDGKAWSNPKHGGGSVAGRYVHWHTFEDNAGASSRTCSAFAVIAGSRPYSDLRLHLRRQDRQAQ